jgi:hypothetical protein
MASEDLHAISADWLKSLEVASSTGDVMSFVNHFVPDGWFREHYQVWKNYADISQTL